MHSMVLVIGADPIGQCTAAFGGEWSAGATTAKRVFDRVPDSDSDGAAVGSDDGGDGDPFDYANDPGHDYGAELARGADWMALGGRYSGWLILRPGAPGTRFGDAIPPTEAMLSGLPACGHEDHAADMVIVRPGARGDRAGVDQASAGDLDLGASWDAEPRTFSALVAGGRLSTYQSELRRPEHLAIFLAGSLPDMGVQFPRNAAEQTALEAGMAKLTHWQDAVVTAALTEAIANSEIVTIVDVHS